MTRHQQESDASERKSTKRNVRRRLLALGGVLAVGGVGYGAMSNAAEVTSHRVPLPGLREELRVLLLSDSHLPSCFVSRQTILDVHRRFEPHLVLIAGDAVDQSGNEALVEYYADLQAALGVFAVLGNWEYWGKCDLDVLANAYRKSGVQLLVNQRVTFEHGGANIQLVGLDDLLGGQPQIKLVKDAAAEPLIVMAHCPELFDRLPARPSIVLSGHTHGGQVAPFGIKIKTPPGSGQYFRGWYSNGPRRLYVTRGLGNSAFPFRLGSRPEITQLTFEPASSARAKATV